MRDDSSVGFERTFKIGDNHGYRIVGDMAALHADLAVVAGVHRIGRALEPWSLQLWACARPYEGGSIQGVKVAEVPVALPSPEDAPTLRLEAETFAALPAQRREYSMVLVLASGGPGALERVHDFANYPEPESFVVPYMDGSVGYSIRADCVVLTVDRVHNPRPAGTLSGSLALELWALPEPYSGGAPDGVALARADLGQIGGHCVLEPLPCNVPFSPPPSGPRHLALLLREWTAAGRFSTRDCCNFAVRFEGDLTGTDMASAPSTTGLQGAGSPSSPSYDEIARAAYFRHVARGGGPGSAIDDWLQAEQELIRMVH